MADLHQALYEYLLHSGLKKTAKALSIESQHNPVKPRLVKKPDWKPTISLLDLWNSRETIEKSKKVVKVEPKKEEEKENSSSSEYESEYDSDSSDEEKKEENDKKIKTTNSKVVEKKMNSSSSEYESEYDSESSSEEKKKSDKIVEEKNVNKSSSSEYESEYESEYDSDSSSKEVKNDNKKVIKSNGNTNGNGHITGSKRSRSDSSDSSDSSDFEVKKSKSQKISHHQPSASLNTNPLRSSVASINSTSASNSTPDKNAHFKRVDPSKVRFEKDELADNRYQFNAGLAGDRSARDLIVVRGKDFRHAKTKKKRAGHLHAKINIGTSVAVKFDDWSGSDSN